MKTATIMKKTSTNQYFCGSNTPKVSVIDSLLMRKTPRPAKSPAHMKELTVRSLVSSLCRFR